MPFEVAALLVSALLAVVGLSALVLVARRRSGLVAEYASVNRAPAPGAPTEDSDRSVIEQLDVGVLRFDALLHVTSSNPAAQRMLHADGRGLRDRSLMEVFVDHRVEDAAGTALAEGSAVLEITLREPDERRINVRVRRVADGTLLMLLDDVSELRRLQRIRSEFIDNLSHELRTPLTTIRLLSETLSQDLERAENVPPRIRERVSKIDIETGHLVQMVNELLDLSRIEGGAAELHFENVNMSDVIRAALERLRTFADRQGISLATEIPADVEPLRVWADGERLGQVLVNLLHNAVKFSVEGTTVTVAAHEGDGALAVEVRDHGGGIPRVELSRIFERFYKVDKARQRGQGGTGLGLAIARHIIEGHGGRIWAESEEGQGSVFTFTVPLAR